MNKVIVTGGAGFIGTHLVTELLKKQIDVTVIGHSARSLLNRISINPEYLAVIEADVITALEKQLVDLQDYDVIFHLAGVSHVSVSVDSPDIDMRSNLLTTFSLLEALRHCNKPPTIIFASTAAVYGNAKKVPIEESDPTYPLSPYAVSKLAAERYIEVYCKLYNISGASLRIFSVYGLGLRSRVVYDIFRKLKENKEHLLLLGDGSQERDYINIDDVIRAFMLIAEKAPKTGEVYNVASGKGIRISELAEEICSVVGVNPTIAYTNKELPDHPDRSIASIDRLKELGFENKMSLREGLRFLYEQRNGQTNR